MKISILFIFFVTRNSKTTYVLYVNVLHTKQLPCYWRSCFSGMVLCELRLQICNTVPKYATESQPETFVAFHTCSVIPTWLPTLYFEYLPKSLIILFFIHLVCMETVSPTENIAAYSFWISTVCDTACIWWLVYSCD